MSGNYRRQRQREPVNANFLKNCLFAKICLSLVKNWEIIVKAEKKWVNYFKIRLLLQKKWKMSSDIK